MAGIWDAVFGGRRATRGTVCTERIAERGILHTFWVMREHTEDADGYVVNLTDLLRRSSADRENCNAGSIGHLPNFEALVDPYTVLLEPC